MRQGFSLCPKYGRNIETYLNISKSIEILESLKTDNIRGNVIIICLLAFYAASYTRVKSEVQVLYRPPLDYQSQNSPIKLSPCS